MPATNKNKNKAAASGRRTNDAEVIDAIIENLGSQLKGNGTKGTIADFIRLLQLREELDGEEVREVKVQWVEER